MENYISINGQKVALTNDQVEKIKESLDLPAVKLADLEPGEVFEVAGFQMVVLEQSGDTTAVICKNLLDEESAFGSSNNYDGSTVDTVCNSWGEKIADAVGADNLLMHTVDLTADDGLKDYGKIQRKASLLTANQYRKYVEILDLHKEDAWWWLATAFSTPAHGYSSAVKCVSPSGYIYFDYYYVHGGVRPFCILKSHIFVSK